MTRMRWAATGLALLAAFGLLWATVSTPDTHAGWAVQTMNQANSTGAGSVAYTHTYTGGSCTSAPAGSVPSGTEVSCPGAISPTAATPATGSNSATDSITYSGTVPANKMTERVRAASCGPVQLANRVNAANPMLARYGTTFSTSGGPMGGAGYITVDGADPGGYEASVLSQPQPTAANQTYGVGIWFKTTSTVGQPIFSFGSDPTNLTGSNDRELFIDSKGHLTFVYDLHGDKTPLTAGSGYNDGNWHFAYVTLSQDNKGNSLPTLYVDGTSPKQGTRKALDSYPGYWHIGWGPPQGSGSASYFTGSLSNFVVLNTAPAPANISGASLTSQTAFNAAIASSVTEHWVLDDAGTTTYTGTLPDGTPASAPCSNLNVTWSFTNPSSSFSGSLATLASGWQTVTAPAPGATQTGTVSVSRGSGYTTYMPGLRLYAPLQFSGMTTSGTWGNTFAWRSAAAAFIA